MKLRTACPSCASVFRLTADQVEAAHGWVQCGVCGSTFDARPTLAMEDGSPLPEPEPFEPEVSEAAAPEAVPAETAAAEPAAATAAEAEAAAPTESTPGEAPAVEAAPAVAVGIARREAADELPSIILIDPDAAATTVELGPLPQIPPAPPPRPAAVVAAPAADQAAAPPSAPGAHIEYATAPATPAAARRAAAGRLRVVGPRLWAGVSVLLLLTLLAQLAWFARDSLVSQVPQLRPLFEQVCASLGCTLGLPRDLAKLQIVGSDLQNEGNGRLTLSVTLGNRADHPQAWPMLVLTLTDARGQPLSRRSFAPSEYLEDPERVAAGVPARTEQALRLPLSLNGIQPMGFDLKLSY